MSDNSSQTARQNWATNIQFQATRYAMPQSVEQLQDIVRKAAQVRVVGAGHSFNDIANTTGTLISLDGLPKAVEIDHENHTATISAGMTYIDIAPVLHAAGYALTNLSSTPHTTVIGACMTGTHGSGDNNKILADQVSALQIVNAAGEIVELSRDTHGERFNGMVVSLGALGVVTKATLDLVPTYEMQHEIYVSLPQSEMMANFDDIMTNAYSVSLGTRWQSDKISLVLKRRKLVDGQPVSVAESYYGSTLAGETLFGDAYPIDNITYRKNGIPAPWYERLPFFNIRSTIHGENERQSEYFVAREHGVAALKAVSALGGQMASFIKLTEIRTMAADEIWLSPAYKQDCVAIHFSWLPKTAEIERFLPVLEEALAPFRPRPHWGKMFTMAPANVQACYEKMPEFSKLAAEFDPSGKFRNKFLAQFI